MQKIKDDKYLNYLSLSRVDRKKLTAWTLPKDEKFYIVQEFEKIQRDSGLSAAEKERRLKNAYRFLMCGDRAVRLDCKCGNTKAAMYYCNTRICPECTRREADKRFHEYKDLIAGALAEAPVAAMRAMARTYKMVTFTAKSSGNVHRDVRNMGRWVRRFYNFWFKGKHKLEVKRAMILQLMQIEQMTEAEAVLEFNKIWGYINNEFCNWHKCNGGIFAIEAGKGLRHIHVHSLILSKYMPCTDKKPWGMWVWRAITGGSQNLEIHQVETFGNDATGVLDAVREVLKYLFKPVAGINSNPDQTNLGPEFVPAKAFAEFWDAMYDVRRVWTTGLFYNTGVSKKQEPCECDVCHQAAFRVTKIYRMDDWYKNGMLETLDAAVDAARKKRGTDKVEVQMDRVLGMDLMQHFLHTYKRSEN